MNHLLAIIALLLLPFLCIGQEVSSTGYIFSLKKDQNIAQVEQSITQDCDVTIDVLIQEWKMYTITGDCVDLDWLRAHPSIRSAQVNGMNYTRDVIPNDSLFSEQVNLDIISIPQAWEISTGGNSPFGDDIVVAVLDEDIDLDHPDLVNNIYLNNGEIPLDGLDNDNNGYVDDYRGFNVVTGNDVHPNGRKSHGSSVCGIIAAEGDNNIGISGINWTAKMLYMSPVEALDSRIISNMRYIYKMRKKYNDSNGAEGAFVVASNMSFGADGFFEEDFPEMCNLIDSLGTIGILSVGAGPNLGDIDIDQFGDKPNDCSSNYLIAVTNSDLLDNLVSGTGFGQMNMDIAAPGTGSFTTARGDEYREFGGASASAPQISGVISLLYSIDCPEWQNIIMNDPAGAATMVKSAILDAADPALALADKVSSGGRLNALRALNLLKERTCLAGIDENNINYISKLPGQEFMKVVVELKDLSDFDFWVFDAQGRKIHEQKILPSQGARQTFNLDVSSYPVAGYIAVLKSGDSESALKFVVTR